MNRRELLAGAAMLGGIRQANAFGTGRLGLGLGHGGALGGASNPPDPGDVFLFDDDGTTPLVDDDGITQLEDTI